MIAKIEQVTTTSDGNLALFATYWEGAQQLGAERFNIGAPVSRLLAYRRPDGLLERLDGVPVPAEPTTEEALLAEQIGVRHEVVAVSPAFIAEFSLQSVRGWKAKYDRAVLLQSQVQAATDEQLLALAAGRVIQWTQALQNDTANANQKGIARATYRLGLAQQAAVSPAIARQLAMAEVTLPAAQPWPTGAADPRGYLAMPEIAAILNAEIEIP